MSVIPDAAQKLIAFQPRHSFFIGIDSDGCAFDAMELKQKECFIPSTIRVWGLQPISKYARETAEWVNLELLSEAEVEAIFARALAGQATAEDARRFTGHMMIEMARMSVEDGLVMQLHAGCYRNHNPLVFERFGADKGADIPIETEWVHNLKPLLDRFGNDPRLTLVLFTMDESSFSRELAPLAGHYPALRLGPPWWCAA